MANLFWPFLVVHAEQGAAIFDGTGVWRRTFRYTLLPPVREVEPLLDRALPPVDYLGRMRALMPFFSLDPGAEVLTVEGFLPLDPPLLFDVLSQAQFRSDPQSAHAGFSPARHKVDWYESAVQEMREWLTRFENDLKTLTGIRAQNRSDPRGDAGAPRGGGPGSDRRTGRSRSSRSSQAWTPRWPGSSSPIMPRSKGIST